MQSQSSTTTLKARVIATLIVFALFFFALVFVHHLAAYLIVGFIMLSPLLLLNKFVNWILPGHRR